MKTFALLDTNKSLWAECVIRKCFKSSALQSLISLILCEIITPSSGTSLTFRVSGDGVCLSPFLCVPLENKGLEVWVFMHRPWVGRLLL